MIKFNKKSRSKTKEGKKRKRITFDSLSAHYEIWKLSLNALGHGIFSTKEKQGKRLKILTPKQLFQRLPISLPQVKACNTSEGLINKIRKIIYFLFQAKEVTKNVYNNIMNWTKLQNRMDTIFMISESSKASDFHKLLFFLSGKRNLKIRDKYVALSKLSIYYT